MPVPNEIDKLAAAIRAGSGRALSRGLSLIESGGERAEALSESLYPYTRSAHVIGITGAPGAGKSTLVTAIVKELRRREIRVGVLAIDPSSPYTGGAILGDRIRMTELSSDPGLFIRSMATRGALGGLCRAAADGVDLLCAAGNTVVIVETVGVGQDEVDVVRLAHSTVVVSVPGQGDDIQTLKAGIIEIADVHVVNKADRQGADQTIAEIRGLLTMKTASNGAWQPPIVPCVATRSEGAAELVDALSAHFTHLKVSGEIYVAERRIAESRVLKLAQTFVADALKQGGGLDGPVTGDMDRVISRELSPYRCARNVLARTRALR